MFTPAGTDGIVSVGCNNGLTASNLVSVGFGGGATVGTWTETKTGTVATLQNYATVLSSMGSKTARTTPTHTHTITPWDMATLHLVGTVEANWAMPAGAGDYGTFKAAFDVFLKKAGT